MLAEIVKWKMAAVLLALSLGFSGWAQNYPEAMFIIDSSGSMQAAMGGTTKLDVAKSVLREVLPKLPVEVLVGLTAYGHRHPKDCRDVEILVPPGSQARDDLLARVDALSPVGMTPIALALQTAGEAIQSRPAECIVVLLTDGAETCGGNPAAVVGALRRQGLKFMLYVVGYDIQDAEKKSLAYLAAAGGGRYIAADDSAALLDAFESVRRDIEEKVEKARTEKVQRKTGLGKLHLIIPPEALQSLAGIQIRRRGEMKAVKKGELTRADSMHPLMSGEYELWMEFANPNYQPPTSIKLGEFDIHGGAATELVLGALAFNIADGLLDNNVAFVQINAQATGAELVKLEKHDNDYYLFKPKPASPGTYDVMIGYNQSPRKRCCCQNSLRYGRQAGGSRMGFELYPEKTGFR